MKLVFSTFFQFTASALIASPLHLLLYCTSNLYLPDMPPHARLRARPRAKLSVLMLYFRDKKQKYHTIVSVFNFGDHC